MASIEKQGTKSRPLTLGNLYRAALENTPNLRIADHAIWVGVLHHHVRTYEEADNEKAFQWFKCMKRTTVRTIKNYYYSRNPLEDLVIKHEDYYPLEGDTVKELLGRNSWGKRVIVLHAIALEEGAAQPTFGYSQGTWMKPLVIEDDEDDDSEDIPVEIGDEDQHSSKTSMSADEKETKPRQRIFKRRELSEGAAEIDALISTSQNEEKSSSLKKRRFSSPKFKQEQEIVEIEDDGNVESKQGRKTVKLSHDQYDDNRTDEKPLEMDKNLGEAMHIKHSEDYWDAEVRRVTDEESRRTFNSTTSLWPVSLEPNTILSTIESKISSETVESVYGADTASRERVPYGTALESRIARLPEVARAAILAAKNHSCGACGGAMELKTYTYFDLDNQPLCGDCSRSLLVFKGDQYAVHRLDNDRIGEWKDNLMENDPADNSNHCDGNNEDSSSQKGSDAGPSWLKWSFGTVMNGISNITKLSSGTNDSLSHYRYPTTNMDSTAVYASLRPNPAGIDPKNLYTQDSQDHAAAKQGGHPRAGHDEDNDSDGDYLNFTFPDPEDDYLSRDYQLPPPIKRTSVESVSITPIEHHIAKTDCTDPRTTKFKFSHSPVPIKTSAEHHRAKSNQNPPYTTKIKLTHKSMPTNRKQSAPLPSPPASLISDDDDNVDREAVEKAIALAEDEDYDWEPESTSASDHRDESESGSEGHGHAGPGSHGVDDE